ENRGDRRHQLIHCYYADEEVLKMMSEAGIVMAAQPAFIYNEADGYPKLLREEQQQTFTPLRSAIDAGVIVSMSTDIPSAHHNPFWGMYSAVTRKGMHGHCIGKEEAITIDEALRAMTWGGAYMSFEEDIKGTLEPGKLADIVVLDRSLVSIDEEDIRNVKASITIVGGKAVFENK
ncbi:MAG: amidohydrolase family protein, partial [Clostridia bacterium]|nr:amidohydrolase family protein [Clostridia bacterium]